MKRSSDDEKRRFRKTSARLYGKRIARAAAGELGPAAATADGPGQSRRERPLASILAAAAALAIISGSALFSRNRQADAPAPGLIALFDRPSAERALDAFWGVFAGPSAPVPDGNPGETGVQGETL